MIVTCKKCETRFNLNDDLVKPKGSKVRCSQCQNTFIVYPPEIPPEPIEAVEAEPDLVAEEEQSDREDQDVQAPVAEALSFMDTDDSDATGRDVSESENLFEIDEALGETQEETQEESIDQGLDLDIGDDEDLAMEASGIEVEDSEDEPEEFDLDLDIDLDEAGIEVQETEDKPEEFDLDLDLDLDEPGIEAQDTADEDLVAEKPYIEMEETVDASEGLDLELGLDMDEPGGEPEETVGASEELDLDLDLDFDEDDGIEIDEPVIDTELAEGIDDELELDLDIETEDDEGLQVDTPELEAELTEEDSEELQLDFDTEDESADEIGTETENIDLQYETEDQGQEDIQYNMSGGEVAAEAEKELAEPLDVGAQVYKEKSLEQEEFGADSQELGFSPDLEIRPTTRKRSKLPVLILIVVLVLGGGAGSLFMFGGKKVNIPVVGDITIPSVDMGIPSLGDLKIPFLEKIPFVGDFFKPDVPDAGNLKINIHDIIGKFVDNSKSGRLFLIKGKVKNDYQQPRGFIIVSGKLYSKGKQLAKTETVFCGNSLSDLELTDMDYATIKKRLKNRSGDKKSNEKINPGASLPFMIVFSDLPENLEEYTIEVKGSSPAN
jgi:predicted Zn finger-like uncharacterized protein